VLPRNSTLTACRNRKAVKDFEEKTYRAIAENCLELYLRAMLALGYS
jgi:hypothetical protein